MQCSNNLKQIGLAAHNYHGVFSQFPSGAVKYRNYVPAGTSNLAVYDRYTWALLLLPYLEQNNLYSRWVFNYTGPAGSIGVRSSGFMTLPNTGDVATGAVAATAVKSFLCPSDPAVGDGIATNVNAKAPSTWSPTAGSQPLPPGDPGFWQWGITSYQGNGGTATYGVLRLYSACAVCDGQNDSRDGTVLLYQWFNGNGAPNAAGSNNIDCRTPVSVASITDGTSNTLMYGEKSLTDTGYDSACLGGQNYLVDQSFWANPSMQDCVAGTEWPLNSNYQKLLTSLQALGGCGSGGENVAGTDPVSCACDARTTNFSSNHTGGVNFVFSDGSVRFLADNIPLLTLQALSTRSGGEVNGNF